MVLYAALAKSLYVQLDMIKHSCLNIAALGSVPALPNFLPLYLVSGNLVEWSGW